MWDDLLTTKVWMTPSIPKDNQDTRMVNGVNLDLFPHFNNSDSNRHTVQALSFLTLAAASSIAGIVDLLHRADVTFCPAGLCSRYQISASLAFLSWFLSTASSLSNLWLLPSLSRWSVFRYFHTVASGNLCTVGRRYLIQVCQFFFANFVFWRIHMKHPHSYHIR